MLSDIITVDIVEHSTSVIDDFCVVSLIPVTVPVRPLGYLTWGNAIYHIFEVGGRRSPSSHATLTIAQESASEPIEDTTQASDTTPESSVASGAAAQQPAAADQLSWSFNNLVYLVITGYPATPETRRHSTL